MEKKSLLTMTLATTGTTLVWLPLLAPVIFSLVRLFSGRRFLIDYLMPAELFPIYLVGALLLLWTALRAQRYQKWIGWSLFTSLVFLVAGQVLAVVTGLASGAMEPTGWQWALVLGSIAIYILAMIAVGIAGVRLVRYLRR